MCERPTTTITRSATELPKKRSLRTFPNRTDQERDGCDHESCNEQRQAYVVARGALATAYVQHQAAGPCQQRGAAEQRDQVAGPAERGVAEHRGLTEAEYAGGEGEIERDGEG